MVTSEANNIVIKEKIDHNLLLGSIGFILSVLKKYFEAAAEFPSHDDSTTKSLSGVIHDLNHHLLEALAP